MPQKISDLLLSISSTLALCDESHDDHVTVKSCVTKCREAGFITWTYAASLPFLATKLPPEKQNAVSAFLKVASILSALGSDFQTNAGNDLVDAMVRAMDRLPPGSQLLTTNAEPLSARGILVADYLDAQLPPRPIEFIDLLAQQDEIRNDIELRIDRTIKSGRFILGPEVAELEGALSQFCGASHSIAVASGTEALLIALMALEIGPGDEVITSPFSFVATAEVIALLGATPVFVDIDPSTYNITAATISAAITKRTKAIMPVSLFGQAADFESINQVAASANIPVIEDAAQSFGANYRGQMSGHLSTIGCTSFFPSKPLGGYGDGGAIFTDDPNLAERMRQIHVHGQSRRYYSTSIGLAGRMDTLQAAILLAKLRVFPDEIRNRQLVAARYADALLDIPGLVLPTTTIGNTHVYAQYTVEVSNRDGVSRLLAAAGVPTSVHYPAMIYSQPAYARFAPAHPLPHAERAAQYVLSLPFHPRLKHQDQIKVAKSLKNAVQQLNIDKAA